ncbi:Aminopeptidase N [Frankliniella fusca]|uniref:Aminopeptidase N n=1 Tax=Frankliniella fusca TaxID=407009 RepID=A0AAE1H4I3_9NEOP|nr:Aminopeptidase N [Frankliniella fusca]
MGRGSNNSEFWCAKTRAPPEANDIISADMSLTRRSWRAAVAVLLLSTALCSASSPAVATRSDAVLEESVAAARATAAAGAYAGAEYRLPVTVVPYEYTLDLELDNPAVDSFKGTATILTVAVRESNFITLHADGLAITSILVGANAVDVAKDVILDEKLQTLTINLRESRTSASYSLTVGEKYTIQIVYTGKLRGDMYGFYKSTYTPSGGANAIRIAATQFEPAYARSAFPCWDEPHYKARFTVKLVHPQDTTALSNARVASSTELPNTETKQTIFEKTPLMSSYLVAFVVSNFEFQDGAFPPPSTPTPAPGTGTGTAKIEYRVYVRRGSKSQAKYASEVGPLSLKQLEDFTAVPFATTTLQKLDLIAIPDFSAGAMENWGLITYRETGIMYDKEESTEAARESIALVIAHEQTHMWFGDLVSPEWWGYVWLNEGFARYLQYVSMDLVRPSWRLMDTFRVRTLQGALAFDALATSHPMSAAVYTPDQIQGIFDRISYDKGASVLHMTRSVLGDDSFRSALTKYLNNMKFYAAKPSDLFQAFDSVTSVVPLPTGVSVAEVLSTWTEEPGYPVVTVSALANGTVVATQARFLSSGTSSSSSQGWWVPLTFMTGTSSAGGATTAAPASTPTTTPGSSPTTSPGTTPGTTAVWLSPTSSATDLGIKSAANTWILANVDQNGFYRVNYDESNWRLLGAQLQQQLQAGSGTGSSVSVRSRAQLLDDAMSLARAGLLRYALALDLARYLRYETDPIPWTAVFSHLSYVTRMLAGSEAQAGFKAVQLQLLDAVSKDVGFEEKSAESEDRDTYHLRLTFRATLMGQACALEQPDCVDSATKAFKALRDSAMDVKPSVRSTVYCAGLRAGTADDWDFLWKRYTTTTSPGERTLILGALGCTKDAAKLDEYLKLSLTPDPNKVRAQDASSVFSAVLSGGDNLDRALKFFKDNFSTMVSSYGGWSSIQNVVEGLAGMIVDEAKLKELEDFLAQHSADLGVAQAAAVRSLETARTNIKWRSEHLNEVANWVAGASGDGGDKSGGRAAAILSAPLLLAALLVLLAEH